MAIPAPGQFLILVFSLDLRKSNKWVPRRITVVTALILPVALPGSKVGLVAGT